MAGRSAWFFSMLRFIAGHPAILAAASTVALLGAIVFSGANSAQADAVVTDCTRAGIQAALNGGGVVTFNCGASPATISITQTLVVSTTVTFDGGSKVTLDGTGLTRIISMTAGSALTVTNITLQNGYAADGNGGGAVRVPLSASLVSVNAVFSNNLATAGTFPKGGAIFATGTNAVVITGSTFLSNVATYGGGVSAVNAIMSGTTFDRNTAINGGGVYATNLTAADSSFLTNSGDQGGGIYSFVLTVTGSTFRSNTARDGGGIHSDTTAAISDTSFLSNTASSTGGGIYATNQTITGSTFQSNTAKVGGGIIAGGSIVIYDTTFLSNTASVSGGAIHAGDLTLAGSTVMSNTAVTSGGGIFAYVVRMTNATVAGNSGAVWFSGSLVMTDTTVVGNGAYSLRGAVTTLPFTLTDSIVAGDGTPLCSHTGTLAGKNIISDLSCGTGISHNLNDPQLGPPQDNGGPTWTMAPLPGSPAIGGSPACLVLTDQRGARRSSPCDIGAYESSAVPVLTSLAPAAVDALSPAFTLTITGTGFLTGTVALWNGSARPTTVLNTTTLLASIPASDLTAGGIVSITARYGSAPDSISNALSETVAKRSQNIAFLPLPDRTFGDAPFIITATASSGLPVSFAASGSCTVLGSTVTLTDAGTCTITASQNGDAATEAAASVQQAFNVSAPTITPTTTPTATASPTSTPAATATLTATPTAVPQSGGTQKTILPAVQKGVSLSG